MSKNTTTLVTAARVRAAYAEGKFTAPEVALPSLIGGSFTVKGGHVPSATGKVRGRLHPEAIAAFNEQVEGEQYGGEKSGIGAKTVTLPLTKMNAKGARLKRPEDFPLSQVRTLAGVPNKKGRLSKDETAKAVAAIEAERGWDKPAVGKAKATKPQG